VIRVNQLGYGAFDGKLGYGAFDCKAAYVMTRDAAAGARYQVVDRNDQAALVYDTPVFVDPDTDQTVGELKQIGGPVDVEGGWYDAGDYLKFTHIAAYSESLLWASARDSRRPDRHVLAEAPHGLD